MLDMLYIFNSACVDYTASYLYYGRPME